MISRRGPRFRRSTRFRLGTLAVPPAGASRAPPTPGEVVAAARARFSLPVPVPLSTLPSQRDEDVDAVVEICLLLERHLHSPSQLAAARSPLLRVEGVRARLKERFKVLTGGRARYCADTRRSARRRAGVRRSSQRQAEQVVFVGLGVFAGGLRFSRHSASPRTKPLTCGHARTSRHARRQVAGSGRGRGRCHAIGLLETTRLLALGSSAPPARPRRCCASCGGRTMALLEGLVSEHFRARGLTKEEDAFVAAESETFAQPTVGSAGTAPADDALAVELGSVGLYALRRRAGVTEAFDRTARLATPSPGIAGHRVALLAPVAARLVVGSWEPTRRLAKP